MAIRIAVVGAKGRMGQEVCRAIKGDKDLELVAEIDLNDSLTSALESKADVIVDFTNAAAAAKTAEYAIANGIHLVIGTTGFDKENLNQIRNSLAKSPKTGVLVAPNFAISAVLMMQFAATAAKYFESAEIIEFHHPEKLDAPSGTAIRTAEMMTESRSAANRAPMPDKTSKSIPGARGGKVGDIPVHSIRMAGMVAHQEVIFGEMGETLTIRHDSLDRSGYMPGVLLACKEVSKHPGLRIGLESYLKLS
ncbi:MAG: 4-hydroxy-tetrahydrodipicolinate reductase [Actinomycetales bacterium]